MTTAYNSSASLQCGRVTASIAACSSNGGFGSNSQATHNHNGHNASTGDGASNAHFFPGQFYDYHWTTTLARADTINTGATDRRARCKGSERDGPECGWGERVGEDAELHARACQLGVIAG